MALLIGGAELCTVTGRVRDAPCLAEGRDRGPPPPEGRVPRREFAMWGCRAACRGQRPTVLYPQDCECTEQF
eukprot:1954833-Prymnesium_polylepis.1